MTDNADLRVVPGGSSRVSVRRMTSEQIDAVVELLHTHLDLIPPVCLTKDEIRAVMDDPGWFSRLHYPESVEQGGENYTTLVGVRGGRVVAAAQILCPRNDGRACLSWIVGERDEAALRDFLRQVIDVVRESGYRGIADTRNPFGIGWTGIPDCWPHVLNAMREIGFDTGERWQSYWIANGDLPANEASTALPAATGLLNGFQVHKEFRPNSREFNLTMKCESGVVGEANIWFAPTHLKTFMDAGLTDIEWIEVSKRHRRTGLGLALLSECCRIGRRYGARSFMLWAEANAEVVNIAMQRLAAKAGFSKGPALHWTQCAIT